MLRKYKVNHVETVTKDALVQRISEAYEQGESNAASVVSEVESDADLNRMMQDLPAVEDLLEAADDAPIIRMLNALLTQTARDGASDIHIEPYERHSSVRFRVDGTLREVVQPNRALHAALISRLKIMAELDISEKNVCRKMVASVYALAHVPLTCVSALYPVHMANAPYCVCSTGGGQTQLRSRWHGW